MSTAALIQSITQSGQQRSQAILAAGQARANSYTAIGNAFNQAVGTIVQARHQARVMDLERQKLEQQDRQSKQRMDLEQSKFNHLKKMQDASHEEAMKLSKKQQELTEYQFGLTKKFAERQKQSDLDAQKALTAQREAAAERDKALLQNKKNEFDEAAKQQIMQQYWLTYKNALGGLKGSDRPILTFQLMEDLGALGSPAANALAGKIAGEMSTARYSIPMSVTSTVLDELDNDAINFEIQKGIDAGLYVQKTDEKTNLVRYYHAGEDGKATNAVAMIGEISGQKFLDVLASKDVLKISKMMTQMDNATAQLRGDELVGISDVYKKLSTGQADHFMRQMIAAGKNQKDERSAGLLENFNARLEALSGVVGEDRTVDYLPDAPMQILAQNDPRAATQFNMEATAALQKEINTTKDPTTSDPGVAKIKKELNVLQNNAQTSDEYTGIQYAKLLTDSLSNLKSRQSELKTAMENAAKDLNFNTLTQSSQDGKKDSASAFFEFNKIYSATADAITEISDNYASARKKVGKQAKDFASRSRESSNKYDLAFIMTEGAGSAPMPSELGPPASLKDQITYLTIVAYDELEKAFKSDNPGAALAALYETTATNRNK